MKAGTLAVLLVSTLFGLNDALALPQARRFDVQEFENRAVHGAKGLEIGSYKVDKVNEVVKRQAKNTKKPAVTKTSAAPATKSSKAAASWSAKESKASASSVVKSSNPVISSTAKEFKAPASSAAGSSKTSAGSSTAKAPTSAKASSAASATKSSVSAKVSASSAFAKTSASSAIKSSTSLITSHGSVTASATASASGSATKSSISGSASTSSASKSSSSSSSSASTCSYTPQPTGKDGKALDARVPKDPCRLQEEDNRIMIENYKIAQAAATKKKQTLKANNLYLFLLKQGPTLGQKHHVVLVGKVMDINGQLGMEATVQQLGLPAQIVDNQKEYIKHPNAKLFCGGRNGALCSTGDYRRVECAKLQGKYNLVGHAGLEFADPEHFIQKGEEVFLSAKPYNILTWNCQVYAKKLINVTVLKDKEVVELSPSQAKPSAPKDQNTEDWESAGDQVYNPMGGFVVLDGGALPADSPAERPVID